MLMAYRRALTQRAVGLVSSFAQLLVAIVLLGTVQAGGIQTSQMGGWPAPFGITFVADMFAALMLLLSGTIGVATAIYSVSRIDRIRRSYGFYPLMQVLLMGANGAFLTGDLFNLYVWFEVLLIASFVLLVLGNERAQMEGALKYVILNLFSSLLFLTGIGILYGSVGTLNLADIATKLSSLPSSFTTTLAILFFVSFGIKAAVFPLYFWLPDSYHTPPATVTALFAALLTKVGVYSLVRVFTLLFPEMLRDSQMLFLLAAGFGMVTGVLGAVAQTEVRRILAFHSVSQIGYMIMGLALFTTASLAGAIYFVLHHSIVKSNLFLIAGALRERGGGTDLKKLGDLITREPLLAVLFIVSALSLAGLPPLSGFWAKLALVQAGVAIGTLEAFLIIGVSLAVSVFTLISMTKIWNEAFWKPAPAEMPVAPAMTGRGMFFLFLPIGLLAFLTAALGIFPEPLLALVTTAAEQLTDPAQYIRVVLGGGIE